MPPYIKDRCESKCFFFTSAHSPHLMRLLRYLDAGLTITFRHRVDFAAKLSRLRLFLRLVYLFLPRLRGRGRGDSSRRGLFGQYHPLNRCIVYRSSILLVISYPHLPNSFLVSIYLYSSLSLPLLVNPLNQNRSHL